MKKTISYPDVICPKCNKGYLIAETNEKNKVLRNICSECDLDNFVKHDGIVSRIKSLIRFKKK